MEAFASFVLCFSSPSLAGEGARNEREGFLLRLSKTTQEYAAQCRKLKA